MPLHAKESRRVPGMGAADADPISFLHHPAVEQMIAAITLTVYRHVPAVDFSNKLHTFTAC